MTEPVSFGCQMFVLAAALLFVAMAIATTEALRALVSLMALGVSFLWIVRIWTWKSISNGDRYTALALALIFFVAALLSVFAHGRVWLRDREALSTTEGKRAKFEFSWQGEDQQIAEILNTIARHADEAGITPETFAANALLNLPTIGLLEDPGREKALTMLTSVVLRLPIPDHPDVRVADVAGAQDITANLTIRNGQVTAEIHGQRRADLPRLGA